MDPLDHANPATPDIMRATRTGRSLTAGLVVLSVCVLASFQWIGLPLLIELVRAQLDAPVSHTSLGRMGLVFGALGLLGLITAAILLHNGVAMLRSLQAPPNALWLWRDTPIVRGVKARRRGWFSIVAAVLTILICIGLVGYIMLTLQRYIPYAVRPGVTVIEQKSWRP